MEITERIIALAGFSPEEAKVVRYRYGLSSAGKKTRKWIVALSQKKYDQLLDSSERKLERITKGAKE